MYWTKFDFYELKKNNIELQTQASLPLVANKRQEESLESLKINNEYNP